MQPRPTTVGDWLETLSHSHISTDTDNIRMQNLLRRVGYPKAVVTLGIVYLKGHGTIDSPPMAVQVIARALVKSSGGKVDYI